MRRKRQARYTRHAQTRQKRERGEDVGRVGRQRALHTTAGSDAARVSIRRRAGRRADGRAGPHDGCCRAREAGAACLRLPCTPGTRSRLLGGSGGKNRSARRRRGGGASGRSQGSPGQLRAQCLSGQPTAPGPPAARLPARARVRRRARGRSPFSKRPRRAPRTGVTPARGSARQCCTVAVRMLAARGAQRAAGAALARTSLLTAAHLSLVVEEWISALS